MLALRTEGDVVDAIQRQVDGLREAAYDRSEALRSDVSLLNARTALYAPEFLRRRADGSEIGRLAVTYPITAGQQGQRMAAVIVRTR